MSFYQSLSQTRVRLPLVLFSHAMVIMVWLIIRLIHDRKLESTAKIPGSSRSSPQSVASSQKIVKKTANPNDAAASNPDHSNKADKAQLFRQRVDQIVATAEIGRPCPEFVDLLDEAMKMSIFLRAGELSYAMSKMRAEDGPQVFVWMDNQTKIDRGRMEGLGLWESYWARWGMVDADKALAWLENNSLPEYRRKGWAESNVLEGLASHDLQKARNYYKEHPELLDKKRAVEGLFWSWAQEDLQGVTSWLAQSTNRSEQEKGMLSVAWSVLNEGESDRGAKAALDWLEAITTPSGKEMAFQGLASAFTHSSVSDEQRLGLLKQGIANGWRRAELENRVARELAQTNPTEAIALFSNLTQHPDNTYHRPMQEIMSTWVANDSESATSWLSQQQKATWFDAAVLGCINGIRHSDPEAAAQWANAMRDPLLKQKSGF